MIIRLTKANFSSNNIGQYTTEPGTLTFNVSPSSASWTLTCTAMSPSTKTGTGNTTWENIPAGSTVSYEVSLSGYNTQKGSISIYGNTTKTITLSEVGSGDTGDGDDDTGGGSGTTEEYIVNFDFIQNNLNDYSLDGTFEIPTNSTVSSIEYDSNLGMNLNNNLPNGLILSNPVDSSKSWTLEFSGTFVTPTVLVGNRRALLGGDNLTPFIFMNGNTVENISFQVSAGSHIYTSSSNMIWDTEVTYKFIYDGNGKLDFYVNNALKETKNINYTGNFVRLLGNIEGKSSAYVWQDVETGKKSYLKTFKLKYN